MGHDIRAKRPCVDDDAMHDQFRLDDHDEEWLDRYELYEQAAYVAYNRRAAGNPLNQVLYLVLGVMDEAYAGCSGNGTELEITLEQFRQGLAVLESKSFAGMTRERNLADDIAQVIGGMPGATFHMETGGDADVSKERQFLERCIAFCESEGLESLTVDFG